MKKTTQSSTSSKKPASNGAQDILNQLETENKQT